MEYCMFKTKDLCLAATLETIGFNVSKLTMLKDKKEGTFWFAESPELDIAIKNYWDKKLKVEPRDFFVTIKGLKNRIYQSL